MAFSEWLQRRRVHALVLTIPICIAAYAVGAVIFGIVPFTHAALWSRKFWLETLVWGTCLGVALAFLIQPIRSLKKE